MNKNLRMLFIFFLVASLLIIVAYNSDSRGLAAYVTHENLRGDEGEGEIFICDVENYMPETFNGCFGDVDGNGIVNPGDSGFISANFNEEWRDFVCMYDLNGDGEINPQDRLIVIQRIGTCYSIPDYQDGSGLNHGMPEWRFDLPDTVKL